MNTQSNLYRRFTQLKAGHYKTFSDFVKDHAPTKQEEPNETARQKKALNRAKGTLSLIRTYYGAQAGYDKEKGTVWAKDAVKAKQAAPKKAVKPAAEQPVA